MSADRITERHGAARVEVDNAEVMRVVDKITDGALGTFMRAAHRQMDPVVDDAPRLWPVRSGRSARANVVEERVQPDEASLVARNTTSYGYMIKFSVRTPASIEGEVRDIATRQASQWYQAIWWYAKRGNTETTQAKIANHFIGRLTGGVLTYWGSKAFTEANLGARLAKLTAARLKAVHGRGAPSEQLAGRNVWQMLVARPVKAREDAVIEESREALDRLARG